MKRQRSLVLPHDIAVALRRHLFPGDGLEAAALLLCAEVGQRRVKLLARELIPVPHERCVRDSDFLRWPGDCVEQAIDRAEKQGDIIIAVHSHPGGLFAFSEADDESDAVLLDALRQGTNRPAGSAIMVPDGAVLARISNAKGQLDPIDIVMTADADRVHIWRENSPSTGPMPPAMAFTSGMREKLGSLSVCVIGVSGTGSIVAEQLARLGVGEIILVDFDKLERRNLNRILNSTLADIGRNKAEIFSTAVRRYREDGEVLPVARSIADRDAILAASDADILFSCVDTAEGRHIADRISSSFVMPLFDVGVAIPTSAVMNGARKIDEVYGRFDYVFPGGSTLLDRGVYDAKLLEAEYLARVAPQALSQRVTEGYLQGTGEEAPGVITLNMRAASACVMEFIARLFPFRHIENGSRARTIFLLAEGDEDYFSEGQFRKSRSYPVASGKAEPLLGLPAFATRRRVA
jgi:hypothetical protein